METGGQPIRPMAEIGAGFRLLVRPPFVTILLLDCFIAAVALNINELALSNGDSVDTPLPFIAGMTSLVVGLYLQVAATLAAGSDGEMRSADAWLRAALRHRCFWRYVAVTLLFGLILGVGLLVLVVGAVVAGATYGLAQAAVVLERRNPGDSLRRSNELTAPARRAIGTIVAVLFLPSVALAVALPVLDIHLDLGASIALDVAGRVLSLIATIVLTRVFVKLGGAPTPPVQTLLYKANAGA